MTFLIDTGADISICKNPFKNEFEYDCNNKCKLTGITTDEITSIGTAILTFEIGKDKTSINFHLVTEDFPTSTDGILGRDFLINHLCKIDYETFTLTLTINNRETTLPIDTKFQPNDTFEIPPRTEMIFPINLNITKDSVILNQEIEQGVFLANSIVPANGNCHIKIINVNDYTSKIKQITINTEDLADYDIMSYQNTNIYNNTRFNKLIKELNLGKLDKNTESELHEIFKNISQYFI